MAGDRESRIAQVQPLIIVLAELENKSRELLQRGTPEYRYTRKVFTPEGGSSGGEEHSFSEPADKTYQAGNTAIHLYRVLSKSLTNYIEKGDEAGAVGTLKTSCQDAIAKASSLNMPRGFFLAIFQKIVEAVNKVAQCFGKEESWIQVPKTASAAIVQKFKDQLDKNVTDDLAPSPEPKK